jgi:myo-inositol-1(or 4)-monophosphatase
LPGTERLAQPDDHSLLCDAVREAGDHARTLFRDGVEHWQKSDGTPVSRADLEVNRILFDRLAGNRGGYGWLSEETVDDKARLQRRRVWVVDPIDGTRAFLRGDPHWTVSVALVEDGRAVLAAIYNPVTDAFYEAIEGAGARLNGAAIAVSQRDALPGCRMLIHRSVVESAKWPSPWPAMETDMRNSMAYRLCLVADGEFDATLAMSGKSEWDLAAADLIVAEAGGIVSDHWGERFTYNEPNCRRPNVLAAGPGLYALLLERARQRRARQSEDAKS